METSQHEKKSEKAWRLYGLLILAYSLFIFSGGVMGFVAKKSQASLVAGSISGLLLLLASAMTLGKRRRGIYGAFILSSALSCFFSYRLKMSVPSGLLFLTNFSMVIVLGRACRQRFLCAQLRSSAASRHSS